MWKVAVIGAGTMGKMHATCYTRMPGVQLVGIADPRKDTVARLASTCGTRAFESLTQVLSEVPVDVVDICMPTFLHRQLVEEAAIAGKHIICEKPLARTLEDARAMIDICQMNGVRLFVGHVVRFFPEYRKARELVKAGTIGRVGTVRTFRGGAFPNGWDDWYASVERGGTLLVDMVIHDFDFLRWCFGDVVRVYAKSLFGRELNRIDHAFVSLRFENGVIAHVEGTWAYPSGFRTEFEFAGSEGLLQHSSDTAAPIQSAFRSFGQADPGVAVPESPLEKSPYQLELEHFLYCLESGETPIVTPEDAYKALEVSLAALESVQTGQVVTLSGGDHR